MSLSKPYTCNDNDCALDTLFVQSNTLTYIAMFSGCLKECIQYQTLTEQTEVIALVPFLPFYMRRNTSNTHEFIRSDSSYIVSFLTVKWSNVKICCPCCFCCVNTVLL